MVITIVRTDHVLLSVFGGVCQSYLLKVGHRCKYEFAWLNKYIIYIYI